MHDKSDEKSTSSERLFPTTPEQTQAEIAHFTKELSALTTERDECFKQLSSTKGAKFNEINSRYIEILGRLEELRLHITTLKSALIQQRNVSSLSSSSSSRTTESKSSTDSKREAPSQQPPIMIALYNHKGGVGKTTATYHLGFLFNQMGLRVLMIDADPQGSLSTMINPEHSENRSKLLEFREAMRRKREEENVFSEIDHIFAPSIHAPAHQITVTPIDRARLTRPLQVHNYPNLFYLPGSIRFGKLEKLVTLGLGNVPGSVPFATMVPDLFREMGRHHKFDIILVDLNPGIGGLNESIIMRSDYLFVPFKPSGGCLEAVSNLVEILPEWFDDMRNKLGILQKDEGPLFLGTFPQIMRTRRDRKKNVINIEEAYATWIKQIFDASKNLVAIFKQYMPHQPNIPSDTYKERVGIVDMVSAGLHAQHSGRPLADLGFPHRRKDKNGKMQKFKADQQLKKIQIWNGYRKIIGTHFNFLTEEHKQLLSSRLPNFIETLTIWSLINLQFASTIKQVSSTAQSDKQALPQAQHFYTNAEIEQLMHYYLQDRDNTYVTTPMQGDGAFGKEDLSIHIRDYLLENIADIQRAENISIFIPFNIGALDGDREKSGNHWTLGIVKFHRTGGLQEIFYIDPLGHPANDTISFALRRSINEVFNTRIDQVTSMEMPLQSDGHNCGPWIVEIARSLAAGTELQNLRHLDINQRRLEHNAITHPEPEATQARAHKKKSKRADGEEGKEKAKKSKHGGEAGMFTRRGRGAGSTIESTQSQALPPSSSSSLSSPIVSSAQVLAQLSAINTTVPRTQASQPTGQPSSGSSSTSTSSYSHSTRKK